MRTYRYARIDFERNFGLDNGCGFKRVGLFPLVAEIGRALNGWSGIESTSPNNKRIHTYIRVPFRDIEEMAKTCAVKERGRESRAPVRINTYIRVPIRDVEEMAKTYAVKKGGIGTSVY